MRYMIEEIVINPDGNEAHKVEKPIHVEPKTMSLLVLLIQNSGKTLSKEEIFEKLWPGTIVTEDSISRCVSQIRKIFNDDSQTPRIIETIPKKGYRLTAPVKIVEPEVASPIPVVNNKTIDAQHSRSYISPWAASAVAAFVTFWALYGHGTIMFRQTIAATVGAFAIVYCIFFYLSQRK